MMLEIILELTFRRQPITPTQHLIALLTLAVLILLGVVLWWRAKAALPFEQQKEHRQALLGEKLRSTPATMHVGSLEELREARKDIRRLFDEGEWAFEDEPDKKFKSKDDNWAVEPEHLTAVWRTWQPEDDV